MTGQRTGVDWEVADDEAFTKIAQRPLYRRARAWILSARRRDRAATRTGGTSIGSPCPADRVPSGGCARRRPPGAPRRCGSRSRAASSSRRGSSPRTTTWRARTSTSSRTSATTSTSTAASSRVRKYATREIRTLDQYRIRYAQTRRPALKAAHAAAPWIVTWDDHEVDNNYAGLSGENNMESEEQMRLRRATAYQAWWEHQPVRVPRARAGPTSTSRARSSGAGWRGSGCSTRGSTAATRRAATGISDVPCGDWDDPARTLLGAAQERWLFDGLARSARALAGAGESDPRRAVRQRAGRRTPRQHGSVERLSGGARAPVARDRDAAPNRTVAITGDIHSNWVNEMRGGNARPDAPVVGAEFVGTSITSGGDGRDASGSWNDKTRAENPHSKWHNARRGYVVCEFAPSETPRVLSHRAVRHETRRADPDRLVMARGVRASGDRTDLIRRPALQGRRAAGLKPRPTCDSATCSKVQVAGFSAMNESRFPWFVRAGPPSPTACSQGRRWPDVPRPWPNQLPRRVLLDRLPDPPNRPADRPQHQRRACRQVKDPRQSGQREVDVRRLTNERRHNLRERVDVGQLCRAGVVRT